MIRNNILKEKRVWCSQEECPCYLYYTGQITREELDEDCENESYVCYESQFLRKWKAYAGLYHNGIHADEPKKIKKNVYHSLCVLTTKEPDQSEMERYIFAVFLIDEFFEGDDQDEGHVSGNSKYKIELSKEQAKKMFFWKYYHNENSPQKTQWGSGLFRYFEAAQILRDIVELKKGMRDEGLADEFYRYYCKIKNIDIDKISEPRGALYL